MKNPWVKKILIMLAISIVSFIGFNLAFMLAAVITLGIARFTGPNSYTIGRLIYLVVIYLIFFLVKGLKIPTWIKACIFSLPVVSTLVLIGVYGYGLAMPIIFGIGLVYIAAVAYYLYRTKSDWTYYYALSFVSICIAYVMLAGIDI